MLKWIVGIIVVAIAVLAIQGAEASSMQGDVDCDHDVDIVDAQTIARQLVGFTAPDFKGCNADVDCSGLVTIIDALKIAYWLIDLPVVQQEPCPDIGDMPSYAVER